MPQVRGATMGVKAWVATSSPSIADSTEMAGVITPSPYSSAEPKRPSVMRTYLARLTSCQLCRFCFLPLPSVARFLTVPTRAASAIRASTPPSPLLSARMTYRMYFTDTTSVIDQKTRESSPKMFAASGATPWGKVTHSFKA